MSFAQTDNQFWFVAPEVNDEHGNSPNEGQSTFLRFSNTEDYQVTVTITQPANGDFGIIEVDVPANSTESIEFRRGEYNGIDLFDLDSIENYLTFPVLPGNVGNKGNKGLKIEATGRITAYYEISAQWNQEIMAFKGRNALGTEFYVPFQTNYNTAGVVSTHNYSFIYSAIDIVATLNFTNVTITPTADMMIIEGGVRTRWRVTDGDYSIVLNAGETFSAVPYEVDGDTYNDPWLITRRRDRKLGGTKVVSTKPIAVNTKDDLVEAGGVDIVADQLVPVSIIDADGNIVPIIGNDYVVIKNTSLNRANVKQREYAYLIPTGNATEIFADNGGGAVSLGTWDAGEQISCEITDNTVFTSADDPYYVFHMSGVPYPVPGTTAQMGGAIVPSVTTCTGSYKVSFVRSSNTTFVANILVRDGGEDKFLLNGAAGVINPGDFVEVIPGEWWAASIDLTADVLMDPQINVIENAGTDRHLFHLGILNGEDDCFYGYFSDFNPINVQGNIGGTINTKHKACYGDRVELVAYGADSYLWISNLEPSFLDDPNAERPVIYPTDDRKYTVVGYGDCNLTDTTEIEVTVAEPIVADFAIDNVIGCSPLDITVANHSEDDFPVSVYRWSFGDDSTSSSSADTLYHTYYNTSDTAQIRDFVLVTENSFHCLDTLETDILVKPEIHAGFTVDTLIGCNPLPVSFTDTSTTNTANNYRWIFGDGTLDNIVGNNTHIYSHTQTSDTVIYDVELQLTSPFFCRDTARKSITLYPYLEAKFTIDEDDGCSPLTVNFKNACSGGDSIFLDYGDENIDTLSFNFISENHVYRNDDGTDKVDTNFVEMRIKNNAGCEEFWYDTIFVYPEVHADYTVEPYDSCNFDPDSVVFHNNSNDGIHKAWRYLWDFADGTNMDTTNNTIKKFYNNTTSGDQTYAFRLTARSIYGCTDDILGAIQMNRAYADFTVDNNEGCPSLNVLVTNNSIGDDIPLATGWNWDFGDGYTDTNKNPLTHIYTNTTDANITRQLTLQVTGTDGCSTSKTIDINVYPQIKAIYDTTMFHVSSCDSLIVDFSSNTIHPGLNATALYTWDFGDGASSSDKGIVRHVYKNPASSTFIDRRVDLHVETPLGCSYDTTSFVRVYPMVNARIFIDKNEGCSPLTVDAEATEYIGIFPATNYVWDYGDTYTPNMSNPDPHQYPVNPPGGNDIYTLRLDVSDQTGTCTDFDTKTITVFDEVLAQFTPTNSTDCNEYNLTFTNTSLNASTYKWDFDDLTTSSDTIPTHIFTNTDPAGDAIYDVELEAISDEGCTDIFNSNVSVRPYVNADFDIDISEECSPFTVTISNNSSGLEYFWFWNDSDLTLGNADSNSDAPTILAPYSLTTGGSRIDSLTLIVGNTQGCYDTLKRAVTVNSSIDAQFTYSQPDACNPSAVEFTSTTLYSNNYKWDFDDGSTAETTSQIISKTFTNNSAVDRPFNVVLTAESPEGCSGSTSDIVTVHSLVEADFNTDISEYCSPLPLTVTNNSIGVNYKWYWDNNSVTPDSAITTSFFKEFYNTTGVDSTFTIKLVVDNDKGCKDSISRDITVYSSLVAGFTYSQPDSCTDSDVTFNDITIPAVGGYTYNWDYGDGRSYSTTANFVNETFVNNTEYDDSFLVTLDVESNRGCPSTYSEYVTVYSKVVADFSIPLSASCPPFENAKIINTSFGDNFNTYEWYVDGSATPDQTITGTGDFIRDYDNTDHDTVKPYPIRLVAYNSHECKSEKTDVINVYEYVEAIFTMDLDKDCGSLMVNFTNNSLVPPGTTYFWDFNDGASSGDPEPTHEFFNSSRTDSISRIVNLKVSSPNFCPDNISQTVTIYNDPLAKFFVTPTSSCPPLEATLINNSEGADLFEWSFDDGNPNDTTLVNDIYRWDNTDIDNIQYYKLKLWVGTDEGCTDSDSITLSVFPKVVADFTIDKDVGCSPLDNVQFINTSTSPAERFFWTFGDGTASNLPDPKHNFVNLGAGDKPYNVFLLASSKDNCQDDTTQQVTVYVQPDAEFFMDPKLMVFPNNVVNLNNLTNFGPFEYNWSFGDLNNRTSEAEQPNSFEYEHWGEKIISLEVNSTTPDANCTDTYTDKLLIMPPLVNADFTMDIEATCLNDNEEITFTAYPVIVYGDEYEYEWDFGDDTGIETGEVVYHTYTSAGLYFVKLVARSTEIGREDEEDFTYKQVRVYANPIVDFDVSPKIAMINSDLEARVEFYNLSECFDTVGCESKWYFGDGNTSFITNTTHNYQKPPDDEIPKEFDIMLKVTNSVGCVDSLIKPREVTILGEGDIKFPNAFAPNSSIGYNQVFKPVSKGVIEYELLIYNRWGELIFTTKDLNAGWNGKVNGDLAKPDVYVWKATGKFTNGRSFELAGDITLIR